jgi:protoheme ferro-lyase
VRAPKSAEGYAAIGGGSPLRRITNEQALALQESLEKRGCPAHVYVGKYNGRDVMDHSNGLVSFWQN